MAIINIICILLIGLNASRKAQFWFYVGANAFMLCAFVFSFFYFLIKTWAIEI